MLFYNNDKPTGNQIIKLERVANIGSALDLITLAEGKTQLRVDFTDDDAEITALIPKAVRHVENWCNISIVYQRIELIAILQGCDYQLPYGPVVGLLAVQDGTIQSTGYGPVQYATSTDNWWIDGDSFGSYINGRRRLLYEAGNYLPVDLKDVCLQVLTFLYENRGKTIDVAELEKILANAGNYRVQSWI